MNFNIPSIDNLTEIVKRIKKLIPAKVSQLENDAGYKTTDTTYNIGTSFVPGLTLLYTEKGTHNNGTMTQAAISNLFTSIEEDVEILKDKDINGGIASSNVDDYINDYDGGEANSQQ